MSISPQATYLSTIIPNAVLPASIDVIEIDRSTSRTRGSSINHGGSVRTVSKGSLASGDSSVSPLLSRRSDGDGSQADTFHRESTPMPTSVSGPNWSESSKITNSQSSPVSSKSSTHSASFQKTELKGQESQGGHVSEDHDHISLRSSVSMSSSQSENVFTGQGRESCMSGSAGEDAKTKQNFSRSLSIMKTKQPPAPPRRTNSLHSNRIRSSSRVLMESKVLNESVSGVIVNDTEIPATKNDAHSVIAETSKIPIPVSNSTDPVSSSPLSPTQASTTEAGRATESQTECTNSSPQKSSTDGVKFERTMSPSSGYSSQSGTPTLSPKGISPTSPEKQKKKPIKPDRSVSRASSSGASPSSSLTSLSSGASESVQVHVPTRSPSPLPQGSSPTIAAKELAPKNPSPTLTTQVRELLNIPPPPKVRAPCPPPPETWVQNRRSFELLCSPSSNISRGIQKPTEVPESSVKQAGTQTEESGEIQVLAETQPTVNSPLVTEALESFTKVETLSEAVPGVVCKEMESGESPDTRGEKKDTQTLDLRSSPVLKLPESQETTPKKEPPPVMKKPVTVLHKEELVSKEPSVDTKLNQINGTEADVPGENITILSLDSVKCENKSSSAEVASMQTLSVEVPKISKTSPPPSPPPAYHPTPPLSRRTPTPSISTPSEDLERVQEENHIIESCWPPPPPPMEGDSVFDGGDEVDFPPPPPLFVPESGPKVMDGCMTALDLSKKSGDKVEERVEESLVCQQTADVPPADQTVTDAKPKVDVLIYQDNTSEEQGQSTLSVSDNDQPLPMDAPILQPVTKVEHQVSVSALAPSSSLQSLSLVTIEDQPPPAPPVSAQAPVMVPAAPPPPAENLSNAVSFRRQPSLANRDTRNKELLSRHKSAPIPKEDANIPLVTPSLLQMVRLRSVNMTEEQEKTPSEDKPTNPGAPVPENNPVLIPGPQNTPQKPIRKSLSLKSPPKTVKVSPLTLNAPSLRLQEAIRMKTAAMSSRDGLPSRLGAWSTVPSYMSEHGAVPQKPPEGGDMHKSPASTASFIFSRSTKKVVIETAAASCPEAQACLKQSLAAELMQMSDQSKAVNMSNGGVKFDKVPPPVAKKPPHGGSISTTPIHPACSAKMDFSVGGNGAIGVRHVSGITQLETTSKSCTFICQHGFHR